MPIFYILLQPPDCIVLKSYTSHKTDKGMSVISEGYIFRLYANLKVIERWPLIDTYPTPLSVRRKGWAVIKLDCQYDNSKFRKRGSLSKYYFPTRQTLLLTYFTVISIYDNLKHISYMYMYLIIPTRKSINTFTCMYNWWQDSNYWYAYIIV